MKKTLASLLLCILCFSAGAQILPGTDPQADSAAFRLLRERLDSIRQYRPTVALVLSGGGARGLAHLGVIKYVEELGIPVDVVLGTSMGGLLAGFYSLGYTHDQLDSIVRSVDWPVMMSDKVPDAYLAYRLRKHRERYAARIPFHYDNDDLRTKKIREMSAQIERFAEEAGTSTSDVIQEAMSRAGMGMPDGMLFGINIRNLVSSVSVGYQDSISFADLPVPYACVATEMYKLRPKYWTSGNISDAIRSTIAIPFYFRAVRTGGEILLDGGMRDNYPVDLAKAIGADIIIGSEMNISRGLDELNSPVDFVLQTINLLGSGTLSQTQHMADLNIHHPLLEYNMMSFDEKSVNDIIADGYRNATEAKESFEAIASLVAGKGPESTPHRAPAINIANEKVKVGSVRFEGLTPKEQKYIVQKYAYPADGLFGKKEVESVLNRIYGTEAFESVTYRLEGSEEPYALVFECQKGQVNELAASIHADTDEYVYAGVHLGIGTRKLSGFRFSTDLKLGGNPALVLDAAYRPMVGIPTFGIAFRNRLINSELISGEGPEFQRYLSSAVDAYIEDSRMIYGSVRAGITYEMAPYERRLAYNMYWIHWDDQSYWLSAFGNMRIDTFDDGYFPTKGLKFMLDARYVFNGYRYYLDFFSMSVNGDVPPYLSTVGSFSAAISPLPDFTIQPSLYAGWNSEDPILMNPMHVVSVGGIQPNRYVERQIPFFGYASGFFTTRQLGVATQLDLRYCLARKNFITLRGGTYFDFIRFVDGDKDSDFLWAVGAEYGRQTIVGPLKIGAQWCNNTGFSISGSIGFNF